MNITLISCCLEEGNLSYPLGTLCIHSAIAHAFSPTEVQTRHLAFTLSDDPLEAAQETLKFQSELIGLSVYLWNRDWMDRFTSMLRQQNPSITLFAGGPEVTANPHSFDLSIHDFLILGEGEEHVVHAIRCLMDNRAIKKDGIVTDHTNITHAPGPMLESLPSPILTSLADPFLYEGSSVLWEMTRGCPFACSFCFESRGLRSVRSFPFERLEAELDYLITRNVAEVYILDPTFNMDKKRTLAILSLLASKDTDIHFVFEIRAELLDEELADAFSVLHCSLQIGLQSTDAAVLKQANRKFDPRVFANKVELLNARGVPFGLDLIIGLPHDNLKAFTKSLDYAMLLKPSNLDIFPLALLPGTLVAEQAKQYGLIHDHHPPYTIKSSPTFSEEDLGSAIELKNLADLFFTKGQAGMWMGKLCEALACSPSTILRAFGSFLEAFGKDPDHYDMFSLQEQFVRSLLKKVGKQRYEEPLLSFIELHQGIAFFHSWGQSPVVELSYSLQALAQLESLSLDEFLKKYPETENQSLGIYANESGELLFLPIE